MRGKGKIVVLAAVVWLLWALPFLPVLAGGGADWKALETRYTVIQYRDVKDVKRYAGELSGRLNLFGGPDEEEVLSQAARHTDMVFEKVREILGMEVDMPPVTVRVYPDGDSLVAAYRALYGGTARPRAFYILELNAIYMNSRDITPGMLAHEMAHAVTDHFFSCRPPGGMAEIWAQHVYAATESSW